MSRKSTYNHLTCYETHKIMGVLLYPRKMWTKCTWRSWGSDCEASSPDDGCPQKYDRKWRRKSNCPNGTTFGAMRKMIDVTLGIGKKQAEDLIWTLHELEFIHVTKCWDGDGRDNARVAFWC